MIAFVKEAEALLEKGQLDRLKNEEGERVGFCWFDIKREGALYFINGSDAFRIQVGGSLFPVMLQLYNNRQQNKGYNQNVQERTFSTVISAYLKVHGVWLTTGKNDF